MQTIFTLDKGVVCAISRAGLDELDGASCGAKEIVTGEKDGRN